MAQRPFDVIVLGLGAMGSAAAYHLAARGKRVLGIEQYTAAHDRGSSHGDSRIIRQAYHEHPAYVPLVRRAYELWDKLERDSGAHLLTLTGGLMVGLPGSPIVAGTLASAREHNLPHEVFDASEISRRYPALRPRSNETAVFERRAGFLNPEASVRAHLAEAERHGAELHFEETVTDWHTAGDRVTVVSSRGRYQAGKLVLCPGAWAPDILSDLAIPFEIRRHVLCWFAPDDSHSFAPDRFPIYLWDVGDGRVFYGFPETAEGIKAAMHSGGDLCTVEAIDRAVGRRDIDELRRALAPFIPALDSEPRRTAVCMYTMTPDEHFVLGLHPLSAAVAIAAGFSGHGFKFSPVIGEILADLALNGSTRHPIELFSPERFTSSESTVELSCPAPSTR